MTARSTTRELWHVGTGILALVTYLAIVTIARPITGRWDGFLGYRQYRKYVEARRAG